jgi:oligopeptide/dipeptide ABC transporter ATP-binding protein
VGEFILDIRGLQTYFYTEEGVARAVDGLDLQLRPGDTFGLAGESGCGKSTTALSILRLLPPTGRIVGGEILFGGRDLLKLNDEEIRRIRGKEISMVFQEPMVALNPVLTVGEQISEAICLHLGVSKKDAMVRAAEILDLVGVPEARVQIHKYCHQMSGGMRQRVMIAIALSCRPKLMIADEPTTAVDVTIQAQILDLINYLKKEIGVSIILITHNLGIIAENAQSVAIMYAGRVVEWIDGGEIFQKAKHPYTMGLLASLPKVDEEVKRLKAIPGIVPNLYRLPSGCKFSDRCDHTFDRCVTDEPPLGEVEKGHKVRCCLYLD